MASNLPFNDFLVGPDYNGQDSVYMFVDARRRWFRENNPDGAIRTHILECSETSALVKAVVLKHYKDNEETESVGTGHARETYDPSTKDDFVKLAETAAIGRALANAGYGTRDFAAVKGINLLLDGEGKIPCDAPVTFKTDNKPEKTAQATTDNADSSSETPAATRRGRKKKEEKQETPPVQPPTKIEAPAQEDAYKEVEEKTGIVPENVPEPAAEPQEEKKTEQPQLKTGSKKSSGLVTTGFEDASIEPRTLEDALKFVCKAKKEGMHGKTFGEIEEINPQFIDVFASPNFLADSPIKKAHQIAAKIIVENRLKETQRVS